VAEVSHTPYIAYVNCLNEKYRRAGFPPYRWSTHNDSPFVGLDKPLKKNRISLISSAGIFLDGQEPFDPWAVNDLSLRIIPKETAPERLRLHHNYFDHRDALKDLNCVFPIQRLRELERSGNIAEMSSSAITLGMGRLYQRTALQRQTVPRIIRVLKREKADAALLVAA